MGGGRVGKELSCLRRQNTNTKIKFKKETAKNRASVWYGVDTLDADADRG